MAIEALRVGLVHTYPHDEKVPGSLQKGISHLTAALLDSGHWDIAILAGGKIGQSHLGELMVPQIYGHKPGLEDSGRVISLGVAGETRGEQRAFATHLSDMLSKSRIGLVEALHVAPHDLVHAGMPDWFSDPRFNFDIRTLSHTRAIELIHPDERGHYEGWFTPEAIIGKENYDRGTKMLKRIVGKRGVAVLGRLLAAAGVKERVEAVGRRFRFP